MQLLYVMLAGFAFLLLWQGVRWYMAWRTRLRLKLEPVPPGPDIDEVVVHREIGAVRVRPRHEPVLTHTVSDDEPPLLAERIRAGAASEAAAATAPSPAERPDAGARSGRVAAATSAARPATELAPARPSASALPGAAVPSQASAPSAPSPVSEQRAELARELSAAVAPASMPAQTAPAQTSAADTPPVLVTPASVQEPAPAVEQHDLFADELIAPPPPRGSKSTSARARALYDAPAVEPVRVVRNDTANRPVQEIEQVIALHVVAREHLFRGEDLLRCLLSFGLRYGDMSIFHRHEQPTGQGRVLFSMAKAVEPGTFDLESMTAEDVPGVTFFLGLPGINSIAAWDLMVDTARRLANELQGDVLDEQQQPLTRQLVEHFRERVQEFERRRLMPRR